MRGSPPGAATLAVSTVSILVGAGNAMAVGSGGMNDSSRVRRSQDWRAWVKPFQLAMDISTGARARAVSMDEAIMMPPVASPLMTRTAPTASMADWIAARIALVMAPMPLAASLA